MPGASSVMAVSAPVTGSTTAVAAAPVPAPDALAKVTVVLPSARYPAPGSVSVTPVMAPVARSTVAVAAAPAPAPPIVTAASASRSGLLA
ncbi:hypothetical protein PSR1_03519 [Anaeromyxobacter sp. PSR-1]|nr:hypothetical protein PSR1_03519 [Anaeromyxobacter sp. PSR-1]